MKIGKKVIPTHYTVVHGDSWFKIAEKLYTDYYHGDKAKARVNAGLLLHVNKNNAENALDMVAMNLDGSPKKDARLLVPMPINEGGHSGGR